MSECRHRRMSRQNLGGTSYPSVYYREMCKECGRVRVAEYETDAGGAIATCVAATPWRVWKT